MKRLLVIVGIAFFATHAFAETYDQSMQSAKKRADYYRSISVTPAQSQANWSNHPQVPKSTQATTPKALKEEWTGSVASVPNSWGEGEYLVQIAFMNSLHHHQVHEGGSIWISAKNGAIRQDAAIPSPFHYEANYFLVYENGTFTAEDGHNTGNKPVITRIQKLVN